MRRLKNFLEAEKVGDSMRKVNLIAVFNKEADKVLMCRRQKEPYKGLLNFVGGKLKEGETPLDGAYRELCEETGITKNDIKLTHLMDFTYYHEDFSMEVYYGRLNAPIQVKGEENPLSWIDITENFFDTEKYAGKGNIGHIINILKEYI